MGETIHVEVPIGVPLFEHEFEEIERHAIATVRE